MVKMRVSVKCFAQSQVVPWATLVEHLDSLAERRPRPACRRVHVASGMDVRASTVNRRVDDEASSIHLIRRRLDGSSAMVDQDEITGLHLSKVLGIGVDPEPVSIDGITKADVTRCTVCPSKTGQSTESGSHVLLGPCPLGLLVIEGGNLVQTLGLAHVPVQNAIVCGPELHLWDRGRLKLRNSGGRAHFGWLIRRQEVILEYNGSIGIRCELEDWSRYSISLCQGTYT